MRLQFWCLFPCPHRRTGQTSKWPHNFGQRGLVRAQVDGELLAPGDDGAEQRVRAGKTCLTSSIASMRLRTIGATGRRGCDGIQ